MVSIKAAFALAVVTGLAPVLGQDDAPGTLTLEELRARWERGRPLWDLEWRVDENGDLVWRSRESDPASQEAWKTVDLADAMANIGLLGWINLLAAGPRDLASLADAERYFSALGLDTSPGALRKRIVTPVVDSDGTNARRAALERILAVRLVQERGIADAGPELQAVMSDPEADPFLREAAADVLATGDAPARVAIPEEVLAGVPEDADFLFFLDQTRIPPLFWIPRLAMELGGQVTYGAISRGPGFLPEHLARAQMLMEMGTIVPFELARKYGNARTDWVFAAYRENPPALWLEAHGRFETEELLASLESASLEPAEGTVRRVRLGGLELDVEADEGRLRASTEEFENDSPQPALGLRAEEIARSPIWLHLPRRSRLWGLMALPVATRSATLEIGIAEPVTVRLRTEHETEALAGQMAALLAGARRQVERSLEAMEQDPGVVKVLGVLRAADVGVEGRACTVRLEMRGITPQDLGSFLRRLDPW